MRLYIYVNNITADVEILTEEDEDLLDNHREIILESAAEIEILSDGTNLEEEEY